MAEDEFESITDSMEMSLSKLWKLVMDRGDWCATVLRVTNSWTWLSNWSELVLGIRSIPRQIDKKSGLPKEEKCVWILEEEIGFWNSQGGEKGKHVCLIACLVFSIFLSLSHRFFFFFSLNLELMITQKTTQSKLCNWDYIATMYHAWGQFLFPENLLMNPNILEAI